MTQLSRRAVLAATVALAGAPLPPGRAAAQEGQDVQALIRATADAMAALQSFRFELGTVAGSSTILDSLELKGVEGSVKRPDSFAADVTATLAVVDLTVQVIGIGRRLWVTDPLDDEGRLRALDLGDEAGGAGALSALINPDRVFLTAVELLENPAIDGTEEVDGVETTVVTGEFDAGRLVDLASPTAEDEADVLASSLILERMPVTLWIDGSSRVVLMEVEGPLTTSESTDVVRAISLFDFDEPLEIPEPTNVVE